MAFLSKETAIIRLEELIKMDAAIYKKKPDERLKRRIKKELKMLEVIKQSENIRFTDLERKFKIWTLRREEKWT